MRSDPERWHRRTLRYYIQALPADQYDVRLVAPGKPTQRRLWTARQLLDSATFLRAKNAEGYNIFARPLGPYVLIDDLCQDALDAMKVDNLHPSLIVETSPHNFQAWIALGSRRLRVEPHIETAAARMLQQRYGGDPGSAKAGQLGRLPGSFNRKPMHERDDGSFPLVMIRLASYRSQRAILEEAVIYAEEWAALDPEASLGRPQGHPDPLEGEPLEVWQGDCHIVTFAPINRATLYASWLADLVSKGYTPPIRHDGSGIDRSLQDIHVLRSMADTGVPRDTATEALHHGSEKAQERGEGYVEQIISTIWERPLD